jgi:hypothetical protein
MDIDGVLRDLSRFSRRVAYVSLGIAFLYALAHWCWRALLSIL